MDREITINDERNNVAVVTGLSDGANVTRNESISWKLTGRYSNGELVQLEQAAGTQYLVTTSNGDIGLFGLCTDGFWIRTLDSYKQGQAVRLDDFKARLEHIESVLK